MPIKKSFSSTRIAARPLGGPRNTIQDTRPAQQPPKSDTSVLVHDCFDQQGGEIKSKDCACTQRTSRIDAAALIRRCRADALVIVRYGRPEKKHDSIVLRREYVEKLRMKAKVDGQRLLPAILKHGSVLSFKKNVIRGKNGTAIELDLNRTDAEYWNTVMVQLGLGASAGKFIAQAYEGKGLPASFTSLENFQMAPVTTEDGLDPEINAVMATTIHERKEGVRHSRHRVRPSGTARDSDERLGEQHETTGQMNSQTEAFHTDDTRTLPKLLEDPDKPEGIVRE
jgi:hypothetical protein